MFVELDGHPMPEIADLIAEIIAFRDAREWGQFHTLRHLAAGLSIEAAELQELMLWLSDDQVDATNRSDEEAEGAARGSTMHTLGHHLCQRRQSRPIGQATCDGLSSRTTARTSKGVAATGRQKGRVPRHVPAELLAGKRATRA
jgi:hypothetical protein